MRILDISRRGEKTSDGSEVDKCDLQCEASILLLCFIESSQSQY